MNQARKIKAEILLLESRLFQIQFQCKHPNVDFESESDNIFSDPFAQDKFGTIEYICPDCLEVIIK